MLWNYISNPNPSPNSNPDRYFFTIPPVIAALILILIVMSTVFTTQVRERERESVCIREGEAYVRVGG
jgi:hypothetical protein